LLEYIDHEVISFEEGLRIVFILTELSEYSLLDVISMKATLEEREIIEILSQIVAGLLVLHSFQPPIQHRDIKPENILVAKNKYKICDFGSCSQEVIDFR
jgi:AP2-associated kinase